jgi:nucleotide-binding universal stress UspA family protein
VHEQKYGVPADSAPDFAQVGSRRSGFGAQEAVEATDSGASQNRHPTLLSSDAATAKLERANMKRILVPIDFSDATPRVIDLARQLAKALDAEIHLVHVKELTAAAAQGTLGYGLAGMPELAPMSGVPVPVFDPMAQPITEDEGEKSKLAQWQKEIAQDGIKVSLHEPTGAVAQEILNQADVLNADLIVMGTHGHGAMYNLLVGSATKGVLKRSARPVLLVPCHRS